MDPADRVVHWLHELGRARSSQVADVPGGLGLRHDRFPQAHDHNRLSVVAACDPSQLSDAADEVLSDRAHRLIQVLGPHIADAAEAKLSARGYEREDDLLMLADAPSEATRPDVAIVELSLAERVRTAELSWGWELPDADAAVHWQLGHRIETVTPVADPVFLAVIAPDGTVAARTDLYRRDGVAQVDEVLTAPAHRGHGYASALVLAAVTRAAGADIVFLVASADDWPQHLYRRLGFVDLARTASFSRTGG